MAGRAGDYFNWTRRHEGTKARRHEGTKARRHEGTKNTKNIATKRHKMHKSQQKMTKKVLYLTANSTFYTAPYSSSIHCSATTAKSSKLTIMSLFHKALHMLDSLNNKRIDLALLLTGYYPVVFVRLTYFCTAVGLF